MSATEASYWTSLAAAYRALGPPLCPSQLDLAYFQNAVRERSAWRGNGLRCLLMGATEAIASMPLPAGAMMLAFDHSLPMTKWVWPGNVSGSRAIACADWRDLPLRDSSVDMILADGSLNCVRFPVDLRAVAASIHRVLAPNGVLLARCYLQPETPDTADFVLRQTFTEPLPSFHYFKLQLLMAMQRDPRAGTRVGDAYDLWRARDIDIEHLLAVTGWDRAAVEMIELYRGSDTIHTFPTRKQLLEGLWPYFSLSGCFVPEQPLGDRTPTLVLSRRA